MQFHQLSLLSIFSILVTSTIGRQWIETGSSSNSMRNSVQMDRSGIKEPLSACEEAVYSCCSTKWSTFQQSARCFELNNCPGINFIANPCFRLSSVINRIWSNWQTKRCAKNDLIVVEKGAQTKKWKSMAFNQTRLGQLGHVFQKEKIQACFWSLKAILGHFCPFIRPSQRGRPPHWVKDHTFPLLFVHLTLVKYFLLWYSYNFMRNRTCCWCPGPIFHSLVLMKSHQTRMQGSRIRSHQKKMKIESKIGLVWVVDVAGVVCPRSAVVL